MKRNLPNMDFPEREISMSTAIHDRGLVLVVDDEPEMCWALARILKGAGCRCETAANAKDALALAARHTFQMALLDAKLPDKDGLELARCLHEGNPGIRIVLVSAYFYWDESTITEAMRTGRISDFVAKPFTHAEILRAIGFPRPAIQNRKAAPVISGNDSIAPTP